MKRKILALVIAALIILGLSPVNALAAEFRDNWISGNLNGWSQWGWPATGASRSTFSVQTVSGEGVLTVTSGDGPKGTVDGQSFSNLQLDTDIRLNDASNDAGVLFRVGNPSHGTDTGNCYYAGLNRNGNLIFGRMTGSWAQLSSAPMTVSQSRWYHLRVMAYGNRIWIYVDDMSTPKISYNVTSTPQYTTGTIGVRNYRCNTSYKNYSVISLDHPNYITMARSETITIAPGVTPVLPATAPVTYVDASTGTFPVAWDMSGITPDMYSRNGQRFTVYGTMDMGAGATFPTSVLVMVHDGNLTENPFTPLPLGSVEAKGWLLTQLKLQKDGLTGNAETLYTELRTSGTSSQMSRWVGGTASNSDWERPPYYVKGLVALAYTLNDAELIAKARTWLNWTLNSQAASGYFGPTTNNGWWPRMIMLYALRDYYDVCDATEQARIITFMTNYFHYELRTLPTQRLGDWEVSRFGDNQDVALWLYRKTNDPLLLELVQLLNDQGLKHTYMFGNGAINDNGIWQELHTVNVNQAMRQPAVFYQYSWDEADKNAFRLGDAYLLRQHGVATGMAAGAEWTYAVRSTMGVETCAVVERMQSNEVAQMILGDPYIGDELEKIAFNALPACFNPEFTAHQYYTLANEVSGVNGNHGFADDHGSDLTPGPDSGYACCRYNLHMGWPYYVKSMWAQSARGGLAALAYGPSKVTAQVNGKVVSITEDTDYPFKDTITFTIGAAEPNSFPLTLRIPGWSKNTVVKVNGIAQKGVCTGDYYVIDRQWADGDIVTLEMPMELTTTTQINNSVAVERGPLVYSLDIPETWAPINDSRAGTNFRNYTVTTSGQWNYGLWIDQDDPAASISVFESMNRIPDGAQPFSKTGTPVEISVPASLVSSWGISRNPRLAAEPPVSPVYSTAAPQGIRLIPFGAEKLRITYFPLLTGETGKTPVIYEAESAVVSGGVIASDSPGANHPIALSGGSFVKDLNATTAYVEFRNVNAPEAGWYEMTLGHAVERSFGFGTMNMTVNGQAQGSIRFACTDGWARIGFTRAPVRLEAGNNTIRLTKGTDYVQLDYLWISKPQPIRPTLSRNSMILPVGGTGNLSVLFDPVYAFDKTLVWSTSDPGVATVNDGGITATGIGTAVITATSLTGHKAQCLVRTGYELSSLLPGNAIWISVPPEGDGFRSEFLYVNAGTSSLKVILYVAGYNTAGKLVKLESDEALINGGASQKLSAIIEDSSGIASFKFFIWDGDYIPISADTEFEF